MLSKNIADSFSGPNVKPMAPRLSRVRIGQAPFKSGHAKCTHDHALRRAVVTKQPQVTQQVGLQECKLVVLERLHTEEIEYMIHNTWTAHHQVSNNAAQLGVLFAAHYRMACEQQLVETLEAKEESLRQDVMKQEAEFIIAQQRLGCSAALQQLESSVSSKVAAAITPSLAKANKDAFQLQCNLSRAKHDQQVLLTCLDEDASTNTASRPSSALEAGMKALEAVMPSMASGSHDVLSRRAGMADLLAPHTVVRHMKAAGMARLRIQALFSKLMQLRACTYAVSCRAWLEQHVPSAVEECWPAVMQAAVRMAVDYAHGELAAAHQAVLSQTDELAVDMETCRKALRHRKQCTLATC